MRCYLDITYCSFILILAIYRIESRHRKCHLDCGVGEKCVLRRSTCSYPPCPKYPICIDAEENNSTDEVNEMIRTHPGNCPAIVIPGPCIEQCLHDGDCRDGEKCCFNGCGNTCKPVENIITGKPGSCPWNLRRQPVCGIQCTTDFHCPGSEKCCITACGSTCSRPCYHWLQRGASDGRWLPYQCRSGF